MSAIESLERVFGEAIIPKRRKPRKPQVFRRGKPAQRTPFQRLIISRFLDNPPAYQVPKAAREPSVEEVAQEVARSLESTVRRIFQRYLSDLLARLDDKLFAAEAVMVARGRKTIEDGRAVGGVVEHLRVTYTDLVAFQTTKVWKRDQLLSRVAVEWYSSVEIAPPALYELLDDTTVLARIADLLHDTVETFAAEQEGGLNLPQLATRVEDYVFETIDIEEESSTGAPVDATIALDSGYGDLHLDAAQLRVNISLEFDVTASIRWPGEE